MVETFVRQPLSKHLRNGGIHDDELHILQR